MLHRRGCAGQHPVTGEAWEARAPAGDRTTRLRPGLRAGRPVARLESRAHVTCRGTSEWYRSGC